ncbi:glycosyltransferase family 4 protein [Anaerobacillus sp. 1_MG-2023]|uniref:glycosyltransferase family 4 protein n=1 Tax=Anaerobacillus sp. 1_MG-2023 TaxID=3062655 RepID=UPI0026E22848|nr:glycosyltransferase family 4 protein [Anaerobacillus sp. 1_MG-2023]MDO6657209.1 glycosyltransferase family 4 protein [Anaerobacillus sp. 1_MG-2023]
MKILYISQHFPPEIGAAQARAYDMSMNLVEEGCDVTVVTSFPNHVSSKKIFQSSKHLGLNVIRTFVVQDTKKSKLRRMLNYFSFMTTSIIAGLFAKKPDVVFATTPQLFVGLSGYVISKLKRAKFVIEVRDLWVDFAEVLNQINNKKLLTLARKLEWFLFKQADHIVVVTHGYKQYLIEKGIPENKIDVITNGVNPTETGVLVPEEGVRIRAEHGLENKFIILYAGNMGIAQGLRTVLEAANVLKDVSSITFVLIGEGAEKERLQQYQKDKDLQNVLILDSRAKQELNGFYAAADLCLVILKNHPLFEITIPSKLFDCLAMNKPILLGIGGESKEIVKSLNAGLFFEPENAESLANVVLEATSNPKIMELLEKDVRNKMLLKYNRQELSKNLAHLLESTQDNVKGWSQ